MQTNLFYRVSCTSGLLPVGENRMGRKSFSKTLNEIMRVNLQKKTHTHINYIHHAYILRVKTVQLRKSISLDTYRNVKKEREGVVAVESE